MRNHVFNEKELLRSEWGPKGDVVGGWLCARNAGPARSGDQAADVANAEAPKTTTKNGGR